MDNHYKSKRKLTGILLPLLILLPLVSLTAQTERSTSLSIDGGYLVPDNYGYGVRNGGFAPISYQPTKNPGYWSPPDEGRDLGSPWGGAKIQVALTHWISMPFLVGTHSLTSQNNMAFRLTGAISPVSIRFEGQATLTPIAFFNVFAGTMLGTGWDLGFVNGMGLNANGTGIPESDSFQGVVSNLWIGSTLQFDLAAISPGDWRHVLFLFQTQLQYSVYSVAQKGQAWIWEADAGENFNGFTFQTTSFLGYQMPLFLNTVGVLVTTTQNIGYVRDLSPMAENGWGSDFIKVIIAPMFNFTLSDSNTLTVLLEIQRERLYSEPSIFASFFQNRSAVGSYWDVYRMIFSYSIAL